MRKYLQIVDRHRASQGLRLANYIIDFIVSYIFVLILLGLSGITYAFITGSTVEEIGYRMENMNPMLDRLITLSAYLFVMFLTETISKGRSLGKLITGTKVIMIDGTSPSVGNFLLRNIIRGIPFVDPLSFLADKSGLHDKWSQTCVIVKKDYEAELQLKSDINTLGTKEII
ncbi:RDD family protein [Chryseobacterium paridis]|uniref:RDD family protein n=1 Tax=Chryseobacterium paridis TaxID=2800328 RepID=A0ABS1FZU5_9FLAO|nr:RDD family protein [Chryseobacterium paridis]MBK1897920.1 RDD family protein [Chryseobacterium paridis]